MKLYTLRVVLPPPCFNDSVDRCGLIYGQRCCWVAVSVMQTNSTRRGDTQMDLYTSRVVLAPPCFDNRVECEACTPVSEGEVHSV
jgi:hypothetical protein